MLRGQSQLSLSRTHWQECEALTHTLLSRRGFQEVSHSRFDERVSLDDERPIVDLDTKAFEKPRRYANVRFQRTHAVEYRVSLICHVGHLLR